MGGICVFLPPTRTPGRLPPEPRPLGQRKPMGPELWRPLQEDVQAFKLPLSRGLCWHSAIHQLPLAVSGKGVPC